MVGAAGSVLISVIHNIVIALRREFGEDKATASRPLQTVASDGSARLSHLGSRSISNARTSPNALIVKLETQWSRKMKARNSEVGIPRYQGSFRNSYQRACYYKAWRVRPTHSTELH